MQSVERRDRRVPDGDDHEAARGHSEEHDRGRDVPRECNADGDAEHSDRRGHDRVPARAPAFVTADSTSVHPASLQVDDSPASTAECTDASSVRTLTPRN